MGILLCVVYKLHIVNKSIRAGRVLCLHAAIMSILRLHTTSCTPLKIILLGNMALAALRMKNFSECISACDKGQFDGYRIYLYRYRIGIIDPRALSGL